jgi:hypothetical protein
VHFTVELSGMLLDQILAKGVVHDIVDALPASRDRLRDRHGGISCARIEAERDAF